MITDIEKVAREIIATQHRIERRMGMKKRTVHHKVGDQVRVKRPEDNESWVGKVMKREVDRFKLWGGRYWISMEGKALQEVYGCHMTKEV